MLQTTFANLAHQYVPDATVVQKLWLQIEAAYSAPARHYHTLHHLEHIIAQLQAVKPQIKDWHLLLFATFYHDIVYKPTGKHNEEKSAALAEEHLTQLQYPPDKIRHCTKMILATKTHAFTHDNDTNVFTDADLSILGQAEEVYAVYLQQIRKEYAIYPDFLYKPGRKKVVQYFLSMPRIFKTDYFYNELEAQARVNLEVELNHL